MGTLDELIQCDDYGRAAFAALTRSYGAVLDAMQTAESGEARKALSAVGDAILRDMTYVTARSHITKAIAALAQAEEAAADGVLITKDGDFKELALVDGALLSEAIAEAGRLRAYVARETLRIEVQHTPEVVTLYGQIAANAHNN